MDAFLVPRPTDNNADAASNATEPTDSDATEHAAERDEDGDATDSGEAGDATEKAEHGASTEYARGDLSAVTPEPPTKTTNKVHGRERRAARRRYRANHLF